MTIIGIDKNEVDEEIEEAEAEYNEDGKLHGASDILNNLRMKYLE